MYNVLKNNVISIVRGDSATIPLKNDLINSSNSKILFHLMEPSQPFELAIFKKSVDDDASEIVLEPYDTLGLAPGLYYYEIKHIYELDGSVFIKTLVQKTKFIIN